jgi:hypothetical protein
MLFDYLPKPIIPVAKAKKKELGNLNKISFMSMDRNSDKTTTNEDLFFKDEVSSIEKGLAAMKAYR